MDYLQAGSVLAYFPFGNGHVFAGYSKDGKTLYRTMPAVVDEWLNFVLNPNAKDLASIRHHFQSYFEILAADEDHPLVFSPIKVSEDKSGLFIALDAKASGLQETQDQQKIFDLIARKMSRALELETLHQNLLQQERLSAIGQMMSTIVHDIRSPINTVNGFVELIAEESFSDEERHEFANIIRQEINSLMNMVTEILDFAKGKTSILPRKSSARSVLKRFDASLKQLGKHHKTDLHLDINSKHFIYVDEDKISRVFYNIAKNALEAMGEGGSFYVNANDGQEAVIFEFRDTGPGVPQDIQDRLFESFVTSGKQSGTGLGLAIVKKIIDEHGGQIEIESEKGNGATFRIKLPVYKSN